jgi:hypothetical protein
MTDLIPIFPREAMQSLFDTPLYDEAGARELLMRVGPPDAAAVKAETLAFSLSELGKTFALALWGEVQASTPQREKEARRLAAACENVLRIVGLADGGELYPMFAQGGLFAAAYIRGEPRGEAATMNALRAVETLRADALKMLEIEGKRRRMKGVKAGRPENLAMRHLVRDLSQLYETGWGRAPGVSTGDKEVPSGPLMRLMEDVTGRIAARGLRFVHSASALRAAWQRLDRSEKMPLTVLLEQAEALDSEPAGTLSK